MNYYSILNESTLNDEIITIRVPKQLKQELYLHTNNISELMRSLATEYVNNNTSKTGKIKKTLKNKKSHVQAKMEEIKHNRRLLKEQEEDLEELNTEIENLTKELESQGVTEAPEVTNNEALNNLIHNRIIKPFLKSRYNNIIDYVNNNFFNINKIANRFGIKLNYKELLNLLKHNKVKQLLKEKTKAFEVIDTELAINNNNNNLFNNNNNNNNKSIYDSITIQQKNETPYYKQA